MRPEGRAGRPVVPHRAGRKEHEHIPGAAVLVIAAAPLRGRQLKGLTQRDRGVVDLIKVVSSAPGGEVLRLLLRVLEGVLFLDRDPDDVRPQVLLSGERGGLFLNDGDPVAAGPSIGGDQDHQPRELCVAVELRAEGLRGRVDKLYAREVNRRGREVTRHQGDA